MSEAIKQYLIKCFVEINEIIERVSLVLQMFLNEDPTIEDFFHCALSSTETCLLF